MALKEGRCVNCGSILMLDPRQKKSHCLYCDAVFPTEEALRIAEHPEGVQFPNQPQPKYEGPNLDPEAVRPHEILNTAWENEPVSRPVTGKTVPELHLSGNKVPEMRLSRRQILAMVGGSLLLCLIFVAVALPLTWRRDQQRTAVAKAFAAAVPEEKLVLNENLALEGSSLQQLLLVSEQPLSEEASKKLFQAYAKARAGVLGLDEASPDSSGLSLKLLHPEQSYLVTGDADGQAVVTSLN